jgi:hypothetical protein
MSGLKGTLVFTMILCGALAAFGFHVLDSYNRWGAEAYTIAGAGALVILMATPFLAHPNLLVWQRILFSAGLGLFTLLVWLGATFAAAVFGSLGIVF